MKRISFLLLSAAMLALACNKDDNDDSPRTYENINRVHIAAKAASMTSDAIVASNAGGIIWKTNDVYLFKNRLGVFGKFQVVSIDPANNYELRIAAVIYNADGTIAEQSSGFGVRGTFGCDLTILAEDNTGAHSDFHWARVNATNTTFMPLGGAVFVKYNF